MFEDGDREMLTAYLFPAAFAPVQGVVRPESAESPAVPALILYSCAVLHLETHRGRSSLKLLPADSQFIVEVENCISGDLK
jgi:hypothetical protein